MVVPRGLHPLFCIAAILIVISTRDHVIQLLSPYTISYYLLNSKECDFGYYCDDC